MSLNQLTGWPAVHSTKTEGPHTVEKQSYVFGEKHRAILESHNDVRSCHLLNAIDDIQVRLRVYAST